MTIEEYVISALSEALSVPVSGSVPHPMPQRFVTVELIGSSMRDMIRTARLSVKSWGESRADTAALYETVTAAMLALPARPEISSVTLNSGYNNTDLTSDRPRYDATFDVVHYVGGN